MIATIVLLSALAAAAAAGDFASLMARGEAALSARDYVTARDAFEKAVALRPSDPAAHYALGRALGADQKYQPAVAQLEETLRLSPGHTGALLDLASIESASGRLDRAEGHYREAIARSPEPRARRGLATVLARDGRLKEALGILRELIAADASDVDSRYDLGMLLMQGDDCGAAVPMFEEVVRARPDHRKALYGLGNCLARLGRAEDAARAMERFADATRAEEERVGRERRAYFLMIEIDAALGRGDLREAVAAAREAIAINPDDPRLHALLGQCLDGSGDDVGALRAYRRSFELNPGDPSVAVEAGRLLAKGGRFEEAIEILEKAARLDPLMPEPHRLLAAAWERLGNGQNAARERAIWQRLSGR